MTRPYSRRAAVALTIALLSPSIRAAEPAFEPAPTLAEAWYRVAVDDQAVGHMVTREIEDADQRISESDLRLSFSRGGTAQTVGMSSRFVETRDHRPLSMWTRQSLGPMPLETAYTFTADGVEVAGPAGTRVVELPVGEWATPFEAQATLEREVKRLLGDPEGVGRGFEMTVLDPSLGLQPVTTTYVLEAVDDPVTLDGEVRAASRWRQAQSFAPQLATILHLAPDGTVLRSRMPVMGLDMTVTLATRDSVLAIADAPELLVQTFVYPDRRLPHPRALRRAVYRLSAEEDGALQPPPETAAQAVATAEDGALLVTVDLAHDGPARPLEDRDRFLRSTTHLGHAAPPVRNLHAATVADLPAAAPPAQRAEALRRAVARHLTEKNLDSVLATAEDAALQRSGDCTEHAVLLTALLRAEGIPARIATGLIYVDSFIGKRDLFAYHMWSQAHLDGRWIDLDATLDDATPFDAAHITLSTSALDDDGTALVEMAGAAPWIGRVRLEVVETGRR